MSEYKEDVETHLRRAASQKAFERMKSSSKGLVEFELTSPIVISDLRASLSLPFEIIFTERNGSVVMSADFDAGKVDEYFQMRKYFRDRRKTSSLMAHTHNKRDNGAVIDTFSLMDLVAIEPIDTYKTNVLLIHENGISRFRKPIRDLKGNLINSDGSPASRDQYDELARDFESEKDITILLGRNIPDSAEGQAVLSREFIERTGMLVETANWEEDGIHQLMDQLNLKA